MFLKLVYKMIKSTAWRELIRPINTQLITGTVLIILISLIIRMIPL